MSACTRPVGGYFVRQCSPRDGQEHRWREPMMHRDLDEASKHAEKLAHQEGCSFGVFQEVVRADPVFSAPDENAERNQRIADLRSQLDGIQAELANLSGQGSQS